MAHEHYVGPYRLEKTLGKGQTGITVFMQTCMHITKIRDERSVKYLFFIFIYLE